MKFGKEFKDQMVPEWIEAYMDYSELKCLVKQINRLNLSFQPHHNTQRKVDIENQESESQHKHSTNGKFCIPAELREDEKSFFQNLDNELEKVNGFYKEKVEEAKGEAAALAEQMDALVALRKKVKESDTAASSKVTSPGKASSVGRSHYHLVSRYTPLVSADIL